MLHKLQYISQGISPAEHLKNIHAALDAGVKLIQLRLKNMNEETYIRVALQTKELCTKHEAQLIVNDNPNVAKQCNSDALHLGLDDMKVQDAKKIVPHTLIGGTANTFEHLKQRNAEGVNYIGLGPFQFTTTKEKLSPVLGTGGYSLLIKKMKEENIHIPVYAIGGITLKDIKDIMNTGVYGIAVSGLITNASDKNTLVKEINKLLYHA